MGINVLGSLWGDWYVHGGDEGRYMMGSLVRRQQGGAMAQSMAG